MQGHDQTPGEGVACDTLHEDGRLLYRCQSMTCHRRHQGCRHVDLVSGVFPSEDEFGYTRDVCAEYLTELNGGDRSIRSLKKEQTQAEAQRGGLEIQPFGACWIEQATIRQKYIEATKELKEDCKRRKERALDTEGLPHWKQ